MVKEQRVWLVCFNEETYQNSVGADWLRRCFYVDDALMGANSVPKLQEGLRQVTALLDTPHND